MIAGHRGHRREHVHALRPGDARHQLQGEERRARLGQRLDGLGLAERIAHGDDHLARPQTPLVVGGPLGIGPGGADLQQDVGGEDLVTGGGDFGPFFEVLFVGEPGRLAGSTLDDDLETRLHQNRHGGGYQGHASFPGIRFFSNCDNHGAIWSHPRLVVL